MGNDSDYNRQQFNCCKDSSKHKQRKAFQNSLVLNSYYLQKSYKKSAIKNKIVIANCLSSMD